MEIIETPLPGLHLLKPKVFADDRGYFFESFNQQRFNELLGKDFTFVQDNQSRSQKNVLRGMHFQQPPHAQGKLVRVIVGAVLDVVVDLRIGSPQFGKSYAVQLTDQNHLQLFIPEGFAHGFLTLEDDTIFSYKCTDYYHPNAEGSIFWNDPELGIDWPTTSPIVSEKDQNGQLFSALKSPFKLKNNT